MNTSHPQTDAETTGSRRTRGGIIHGALTNRGVWMSKLQEGGWWDDVCYVIKDNNTFTSTIVGKYWLASISQCLFSHPQQQPNQQSPLLDDSDTEDRQ